MGVKNNRAAAQPHCAINTLILSFSALFIIGAIAFSLILFFGSRSMDQQRVDESRYFAGLELESIYGDLGLLAKDNSWWDEIIIHSTPQPDPEWVRKTYIPYLSETLKISDMIVIGGDNQTLYAIHDDTFSQTDATELFDTDTLQLLLNRARSASSSEPEPFNGLAIVQGQIMVVSASALTPEEEGSTALPDGLRPVLLFMRPFSTALFKEHSKKLILNRLQVISATDTAAADITNGGSFELKDIHGKSIGYLSWHVDAVAHRMIEGVMPLLLLLMLIVTALATLVIRSAFKARNRLRILSSAIEQAGEAIAVTDLNGITVYINNSFSKLTGYEPEELIGHGPAFLQESCQTIPVFNALWTTVNRGEIWQNKVTARRKDGSRYPAMMSAAPIYNDAGHISHVVCIQQNISDYEQLEQSFLQAQKMEAVGILAGGIAHNFNNLLAGITGYAYLIKQETLAQPAVQARIDHINELSYRAAEVIGQLLTFARKAMVHKQPLHLHALISDTMALIRLALPENIRLEYTHCEDECHICGDHNQLQQLLLNLANNARDALKGVNNPALTIRLQRLTANAAFRKLHPELQGDAFACITLVDNGCGIAAEDMPHLFEPFFTTKEVGKGSGLGLAMAFGAVKTHDGAIDIESSKDQGTTFSIYLPLCSHIEHKPDTVGDATTNQTMQYGQHELILLADDAPEVLDSIAAVLERLNYRLLKATDGVQAIELFALHQSDIQLAILDIMMPEKSGIEVAKTLRNTRPALPIIFLTGYDKSHASEITAQLESCMLLEKPPVIQKLAAAIHQLIEPDPFRQRDQQM
ncbi:PAS domain S-box protein [Mariprofundus erugo]|uniref:ATP-binding protein n=1 Tax=Mariprofundus erugo TaxID=2528639 RepID=UPI0010FDCB33|nr:ATP-binding protein [Mariprofundus erugo]TLS74926.1 PAS domain S-box protein [Mariprofundus erugo]